MEPALVDTRKEGAVEREAMQDKVVRRRRWLLNLLASLLVVAGLLASAGAALAQTSFRFSLGCWAITSAGSTGGLYQSANFRMKYAVSTVAATETQAVPASANFRLRSNHFAARALAIPPGTAGTPPAGPQFQYLPLAFGRIINLSVLNVCR